MKRAARTDGDGAKVTRFRRLLTSEMIMGVTVLLSVGVLTTLPPARVASEAPMLSGSQEADDLQIELEVTPGRPGLNTFQIKDVSLRFAPTTVDLPPGRTQLTAQGNGEYHAEGGFLALPDAWQLQVAVRREGAYDAYANFDFNVGGPAEAINSGQAIPWFRVSGSLLLATALAYGFALHLLVRGRRQTVAYRYVPGAALLLAGFLILSNPPGNQKTLLVNPIAPNVDSIASGGVLYEQNCLPCHGVSGAGDGPVGRTLNPPPADLILHTVPGVHPDGRLYDWISNGFPDSVMPAFKDNLTDEERWHLVNYIRTLSQP